MPSDLWTFAQRLYALPEIEAACLRLQDAGGNICLLLCACWLGRQGVACVPDRVATLKGLSEPWQEQVIEPLRGLRQGWRVGAREDAALHGLRERLKELELAAERELLVRLERACESWTTGKVDTLRDWLSSCAPLLDTAGRDALERLCIAALAMRRQTG